MSFYNFFRHYKNIINNYFTKINYYTKEDTPKHLGRWKIENCYTKINNKIDLSNEDHCGPCGQYNLLKNKYK